MASAGGGGPVNLVLLGRIAIPMPLPYLIACKLPAVRLFELDDGRFQLIQQGPIAPFMAGYGYLLVERPLGNFLNAIGVERVQQEPVVLFNRGTGEEHDTHVRLRVGQLFQADQIHGLPLEGLRMLTMNDEYYFVSPALKVRFEASPFTYLRFSEGLSEFASDAA